MNVGWKDRLRYRFDRFMGRGTPALVGALATATLVTAIVAAGVVTLFNLDPDGGGTGGFGEALWRGLEHAFTPSTVFADRGGSYRLVMFVVAIVGLFIFSTLIGVLTTAVSERIDSMRKGRSRVLETGHTIVLGWSPRALTVLSELVIANESRRRAVIVVLAPDDKVTMEDAIRERLPAKSTTFICRSGSCIDVDDLAITNVAGARSIIVLPVDGPEADHVTIKSLMAVRRLTGPTDAGPTVVCAMRDPANVAVARLAGPRGTCVVLGDDLTARITVQACRQSGLSIVIQELLDFTGDEIYFAPSGLGVGRTYGEQLVGLASCVALGIRSAGGHIALNPPADTPVGTDDRLIVISDDESHVQAPPLDDAGVEAERIVQRDHAPVGAKRVLVLGWNKRAPRILRALDAFVGPGSSALVVAREPIERRAVALDGPWTSITLEHRVADATQRGVLDGLDVGAMSNVIVLASDGPDDPQVADARTVVILLHVRDIVDASGADVGIVTEMLDARNRDLATITRADDFIVSDRLVGLLMVQLAENPELDVVFNELFSPEGSEIGVKPAGDYVDLGVDVRFTTIIASALRRGETAIGYRLAAFADDAAHDHGVVLNPDRAERRMFAADDRVIVLAPS
ncbi:MAG: potassium transporter TrkA [Ardenticatenales bacterium]